MYLFIYLFVIKENDVTSTNLFAFLVTRFAYYPVRIIKPLYVNNFFSLTRIFSSKSLKLT